MFNLWLNGLATIFSKRLYRESIYPTLIYPDVERHSIAEFVQVTSVAKRSAIAKNLLCSYASVLG